MHEIPCFGAISSKQARARVHAKNLLFSPRRCIMYYGFPGGHFSSRVLMLYGLESRTLARVDGLPGQFSTRHFPQGLNHTIRFPIRLFGANRLCFCLGSPPAQPLSFNTDHEAAEAGDKNMDGSDLNNETSKPTSVCEMLLAVYLEMPVYVREKRTLAIYRVRKAKSD